MNKLKKTIIILIIVLIIMLISIIAISMYKNSVGTDENSKFADEEFEKQISYENNENIEKVKNANKYYTVSSLVERYMSYIVDIDSEDEEIRDLVIEAIDDILDDEYKKEFNITKDSIKQKYKDYGEEEVVVVDDIYVTEKSASINVFLIYGRRTIDEKDFKLMIKMDSLNNRFSVFPEEYMKKYEYSHNSSGEDIDIDVEEIQEKDFNKFVFENISDERMAVQYFNEFKRNFLSGATKAYGALNEEYRKERFGSFENFKEFVEKEQEYISRIEINGYLVENKNNEKKYICKDQNGNLYIFKELAIEEYEVTLDTYTLEDEEMVAKYNSLDEQGKVMANVSVWIQMLNNRDYKAAYNVLDETFRNDNFGSLEKFEEYAKKIYSDFYKIEYTNFSYEGKTFIQKVNLTDITEKEDFVIGNTIIMQLKEGTDFVMSFNIIRHSR